MRKIYAIASIAALLVLVPTLRAAEKPSLVVNIIVSQMRYDCMSRFGQNFSDDGLGMFFKKGMRFTQSYYDFMQTTTPATLATLSTGTNPSMHGVIAANWIDYTSGRMQYLVADDKANSFESDPDTYRVSNKNIIVPTLGDKLLEESPESRVVTVAGDVLSAVVLGGMTCSDVYWIDSLRGKWTTSNRYLPYLPDWVTAYNDLKIERNYVGQSWTPCRSMATYVNRNFSVMNLNQEAIAPSKSFSRDYPDLMRNPAANDMVADFARNAVDNEKLGQRDCVDLLNVCFDASREVLQLYGPESMEAEDMYYRLDKALDGLMTYIRAAVGEDKVLFVLTSDHGASDSYDFSAIPKDRFNVQQFKVVVGSFLGAMYGGEGDWVSAYIDRQIYLNRTLVTSLGLNLYDVQKQAAAFALEFRGVSHVLTSSDMQSGYFGSSYAQKMQNGFYPKRSGDLTVNLMAGWIEQNDYRSASGSMYDYDTHVPLVFTGCGLEAIEIDRAVDMSSLAATLARVMGINRPIASTAEPISEVIERFR